MIASYTGEASVQSWGAIELGWELVGRWLGV